jgi:hypothetical protein
MSTTNVNKTPQIPTISCAYSQAEAPSPGGGVIGPRCSVCGNRGDVKAAASFPLTEDVARWILRGHLCPPCARRLEPQTRRVSG